MGDLTTTKSENLAKSKSVSRIESLKIRKQQPVQRQNSLSGIEELVQCGICLEKLTDPRMLPCQHTFCLRCLQSYLMAQELLLKKQSAESQKKLNKSAEVIQCPLCQKGVHLDKGINSLNDLPKNLYIESLLKLLSGDGPILHDKPDSRCSKCHIFTQEEQQYCQHCIQVFCNVCWNEHLSDLESNLAVLVKQVNESKLKLDCKLESFESRCQQLIETIKATTVQRIELLKMDEEKVLKDVELIVQDGKVTYDNILAQLEDLKCRLSANTFGDNPDKVFNFMKLHRETSRLLTSVSQFTETRVIFDPDSFTLDETTEGVYHDGGDDEFGSISNGTNPSSSFKSTNQHYTPKSFIPKLVWSKCPRPANVAVPPWDNRLLYIAATDTHTVLILDRNKRKLQGRLTSPEMQYPQGIAFSRTHEEVYVTDKWKHCIHAFSKTGEYLRCMLSKGNGIGKVRSPDGIAMSPNEELVVCDSGNDRIILINPQTGAHLSTIGIVDNKTMFRMPTGVAVHENRIFVADTGNNRIKVFSMDGKKMYEFGTSGKGSGQFRYAEVVTVDPAGFILVGDGGNARVQIFKPDGSILKIFGGLDQSNGGFGWVSGICVTPEFDIVVADRRKRRLTIF